MSTPVTTWGPGGAIEVPQPEPAAVGLTSVANVSTTLQIPSEAKNRWELGYRYYPQRASSARNRSQLTQDYGVNLAGEQGPGLIETVPWLVTVEHSTTAFEHEIEDWPAYVANILEVYTSKALEHELWTGEITQMDGTNNRYLASEDTVVVDGGPFNSVKRAVAALSRAASDEGAANIAIHAPRDVAIMMPGEWSNANTSEQYGFSVIPGAGYTGIGPDGSAPASGTAWLFASEVPNVKLSGAVGIPDTLAEAIDKRTNTLTFYAERYGAVDFAGPVFACRVSL